ncbi:FG-GAP repeat protein, partial [Candidatus Pacearchaeota archaeon]|nr:FG-GAP repeat protein [Candidatus Pacearchaeota archaeon]
MRISNISRSADWIAAQYLSMTDDFITYNAEEGANKGRAYIFYGDGSIPTAAASADRTFTGENGSDEFGFSVSNAGDVNNDGYDDVIVGAPYNDGSGSNAGRAYIYYGLSSTPGATDYTDSVTVTKGSVSAGAHTDTQAVGGDTHDFAEENLGTGSGVSTLVDTSGDESITEGYNEPGSDYTDTQTDDGTYQEIAEEYTSGSPESGDPYLLISLPSAEKGTNAYWETTVVNPTDSDIHVETLTFDWGAAQANPVIQTQVYPTAGWTVPDNYRILWDYTDNGNQRITVPSHDAVAFQVFAKQGNLNSATPFPVTVSSTLQSGEGTISDRTWNVLCQDKDSGVEIHYGAANAVNTTRDANFVLVKSDSESNSIQPGTTYNWSASIWESVGKAVVQNNARPDLEILIPSGWTDVEVTDGSNFTGVGVTGDAGSGWTITGENISASFSSTYISFSFDA